MRVYNILSGCVLRMSEINLKKRVNFICMDFV